MIKKVEQISEQAFLLDFGNDISKKTNKRVINFFYFIINKIKSNNYLNLKNCVPSYNKLLIQFDPLKKNKNEILDFLNSIKINENKKNFIKKNICIPICYDEEFAIDLKKISKKINIDENEIINIHLSTNFFVYMIGFMPGLPFMGDLDKLINIQRLKTPRIKVPARSVGIIEKLCVIYPNDSPGGWNIIGKIPEKIFFKNKKKPSLLEPGFSVKFINISKKEFLKLEKYE